MSSPEYMYHINNSEIYTWVLLHRLRLYHCTTIFSLKTSKCMTRKKSKQHFSEVKFAISQVSRYLPIYKWIFKIVREPSQTKVTLSSRGGNPPACYLPGSKAIYANHLIFLALKRSIAKIPLLACTLAAAFKFWHSNAWTFYVCSSIASRVMYVYQIRRTKCSYHLSLLTSKKCFSAAVSKRKHNMQMHWYWY